METVSTNRAFEGVQGVYRHESATCGCPMTFAVYVPPQAKDGPCPVLWYLSGLTCTHANVMEKGEYRKAAAEHGVIIVCPDTSPRGETIANDEAYDLGQGAGFYVDATEAPWAPHFKMYSYVTEELPALIAANFPADMNRQAIFGHSMGGHGALTVALKNPGTYRSVSAFAPITNPIAVPWGQKALAAYLGPDQSAWRAYDATALVEDGSKVPEILVDQGDTDNFLSQQLDPAAFKTACETAGIALTLNMRPGYDHSYYFISTFMADHIAWHAERLTKG
ncbi:S-formylglutathione hydrolase [Microbaculum marinisediminis]|uniref:S-formylglutathione hydrolase n=1 Tax=Microbaculum marinisediminis TaxID=2931392 RepID=A0AAW5R2M8_9HYPH|nr:S-formylglutathione hydrolase [Microbaculum sp. A6E488]MCT8974477.1 S-formylglutathione hydrolase [Microbaculum sp. A6E488]